MDEGNSTGTRQGFLAEEYRIFHIRDQEFREYRPHYHDFCKVLLFLAGSVDYTIEGRTYSLEPGDIVLVNSKEIHCPQVRSHCPYERIIFYLSPLFLKESSPQAPLNQCFLDGAYRHSSVLRPEETLRRQLFSLAKAAELASRRREKDFAGPLYCRLLVLEFMVLLNRTAASGKAGYLHTGAMDYRVASLISYINGHLSQDLSIELLAKQCCLSPYHMMRLFKEETGCTIGKYISQKRLSLARELLETHHANATQACFQSGFANYSTFLRAYKKQYGSSPGGRSRSDKG